MPVSEAKSSHGAVFKRDGNPVAELTEIGDLEIKVGDEDVSSHDFDWVQMISDQLLDAGDLSLKGNFIPSDTLGQIGMKADILAGTIQNFEIVFPPSIAATWVFTAFVSSWKIPSMPTKGKLEWEAKIRITGEPVLSISASTGLTTTFFAVSGAGTLIVPAASGSVYNYTVNIATGVATVTITPTATAGVITVTANGASQVVATGVSSSAITLGAAGSIVVATIEVKETGKVAKTYTLDLTRATA